MTQIEVHKGVAYTVEQTEPLIKVHKALAVIVEQPLERLIAHKAVGYAVEQIPPRLRPHKAVAYAVEQPDDSGNAKQTNPSVLPIYRDGARPYVDFSSGDSLFVNIIFPGQYTALIYKSDDTFEKMLLNLSIGLNNLPVVDFNQMILLLGDPPRIVIESLKLTMRSRVVPTDLPVRPPDAILLSGDMNSGSDNLLLSGDMTDGDDVELISRG
jgi:hypothetical protein